MIIEECEESKRVIKLEIVYTPRIVFAVLAFMHRTFTYCGYSLDQYIILIVLTTYQVCRTT